MTTSDKRAALKVQTAIRLAADDYHALVSRAASEDRSLASLVRRGVKLVLAETASER